VFEGKHREWAIHWRSTVREFGLGWSPTAPYRDNGQQYCINCVFLPLALLTRLEEELGTGEILLLSEKVLLIVVGLMAVVLAIAALVMWVF
jgi:hypothetical protein